MITRIATKKDTQLMIKAIRAAGLKVNKTDSGYLCELSGKTIFQAMNGARGYLIRMQPDLFGE